MSSRNIHYGDLGYTYYPAKIDSRDGIDPNTGVSDPSGFAINEDLELNVNYEDRGNDPAADDYYVHAQDVNVLQDAIISLQRILGQMPHIRTDVTINDVSTVSARIGKLESMSRFDNRFGGTEWVGGTSPTILSHTHTGGINDAAKIELATMTSGELGKSNIQLDMIDPDPLTSKDIIFSPTNDTSIQAMLSRKLDMTTGGSIQKNLVVKGNVVCRAFGEIDCADMSIVHTGGGVPVKRTDSTSYGGRELLFQMGAGISPSTCSAVSRFPLRYNEYSIIVRIKSSNATSTSNIFAIGVYGCGANGVDTQLMAQTIKCNQFSAVNKHQSFYFAVDHKNLVANPAHKDLIVKVFYHGNGVADLSLDSITIMPVHTAVWDEE